jgi:phosphatidylglycerol---prolipoprotein diacylglyceryl transferase
LVIPIGVLALPFPAIDPVAINIGPLVIRWYALAYIFGLLGSFIYALVLLRNERLWRDRPRPNQGSLIELLLYVAIGTIIGGRVGQVLFYDLAYYAANPLEIVQLWHGGMSFHGGLIGVLAAIWYFAKSHQISFLTVADICATVCPIPIFLVRLGNFIQQEHWGRPTELPWAIVFPDVDANPRHPSQLYEAAFEGLFLLLVLGVIAQGGGLRRPGLLTGSFAIGYALARIAMEFFREPDPDLEQLAHGLTMGMVLSVPMIVVGVVLIIRSGMSVGAPPMAKKQ